MNFIEEIKTIRRIYYDEKHDVYILNDITRINVYDTLVYLENEKEYKTFIEFLQQY